MRLLHRHKWKSAERQFPIPDSPIVVDVLFEHCTKCGVWRYATRLNLSNRFTKTAIIRFFRGED